MKRFLILLLLPALACTLPSRIPPSLPTPQPTITPTMIPAPVSTPRAETCARVIASSLHVRYYGAYEADVIGWFSHDELLSVRNRQGAWWLVHGHGVDFLGRKARMTGYVKADWLQLENCNVQTRSQTRRR